MRQKQKVADESQSWTVGMCFRLASDLNSVSVRILQNSSVREERKLYIKEMGLFIVTQYNPWKLNGQLRFECLWFSRSVFSLLRYTQRGS